MIPPQNVPHYDWTRLVLNRIDRCRQLIADPHRHSDRPWTMVVLSCKRPTEFARLLCSLKRFVRVDPDTFDMRRILVDNGSGDELIQIADRSQLFDDIFALPQNIGMGPAINLALGHVRTPYVLFVEDDLVFDFNKPVLAPCASIFRESPTTGIVKFKNKAHWDTMYPYRRIGPMQTTSTGVRFHPWLPSPRWTFRWGQRPWFPVGIHNVWSLGPVAFRHCLWADAGPIPSGQGRGQAIAAEEQYARTVNLRWLSAYPCDVRPFVQPDTAESPGFVDRIGGRI